MDCYYFNTFANIYKEKNYKIKSNSERFTDDMDIDKFEQLRMDYIMRPGLDPSFADTTCFAVYIWQARRFMKDSGLYLCDRDGTPLSSAEIDNFICEECETHAATLVHETDDRVLCADCRSRVLRLATRAVRRRVPRWASRTPFPASQRPRSLS